MSTGGRALAFEIPSDVPGLADAVPLDFSGRRGRHGGGAEEPEPPSEAGLAAASSAAAEVERQARERRALVALVMRAQAGDRSAFARLWERHAQLVHAILLSMIRDQDARDLTQEVALAAWRAIARVEDPARFSSWLSAIARNHGRDALKSSRAATERLNARHERELIEEERGPAAFGAEDVLQCIRELPEAYREPLTLRLLLELPAREIAERTGLTPGSVRVNLCRGMKLLRAALESRD
jgi:RNA polymerase sigma-70 factor (ECF subfamily)